jgi:hypothetical protein
MIKQSTKILQVTMQGPEIGPALTHMRKCKDPYTSVVRVRILRRRRNVRFEVITAVTVNNVVF